VNSSGYREFTPAVQNWGLNAGDKGMSLFFIAKHTRGVRVDEAGVI